MPKKIWKRFLHQGRILRGRDGVSYSCKINLLAAFNVWLLPYLFPHWFWPQEERKWLLKQMYYVFLWPNYFILWQEANSIQVSHWIVVSFHLFNVILCVSVPQLDSFGLLILMFLFFLSFDVILPHLYLYIKIVFCCQRPGAPGKRDMVSQWDVFG